MVYIILLFLQVSEYAVPPSLMFSTGPDIRGEYISNRTFYDVIKNEARIEALVRRAWAVGGDALEQLPHPHPRPRPPQPLAPKLGRLVSDGGQLGEKVRAGDALRAQPHLVR